MALSLGGEMYQTDILEQGCEKLGITLNSHQIQQFLVYYENLIEKNKVMNLTGITDFQEVMQKHFIDSLSIVKSVSMDQMDSVIDIGTGAGFPGIPLKIAFSHLKITLLDSLNKRILFLNEIIDLLHLDSIETIHGRAEDFAHNIKYREKYDCCVSRAVANLSSLCEYCIPFVKKDGLFISYKSRDSEAEISSAKTACFLLGGKIIKTDTFNLPDTEIGRTLVSIKKVKNTPKQYPRKAGIPSKNPL